MMLRSMGPRERVWLAACALAWIVLAPTSAWLGSRNGLQWRVFAPPVAALSGALGSLVLAVLIFDRIQLNLRQEQEKRAADEWIEKYLAASVDLHRGVQTLIVQSVEVLYGVIVRAGFISDPIPTDYLANDIGRSPRMQE